MALGYFCLGDPRFPVGGPSNLWDDYTYGDQGYGLSAGWTFGGPGLLASAYRSQGLLTRINLALNRQEEGLEAAFAWPISDSVFMCWSLRSVRPDSTSPWGDGLGAGASAYFATPEQDVGLGIQADRAAPLRADLELTRRFPGGFFSLRILAGFGPGMGVLGVGTGPVEWYLEGRWTMEKLSLGGAANLRLGRWRLGLGWVQGPLLTLGYMARQRPRGSRIDTHVLAALPPDLLPWPEDIQAPKATPTTRPRHRSTRTSQERDTAQAKPKASPEEIEALYLKGVEAYRWEDYRTAIYYWRKVLELDPDNEKAKRGIARAMRYLEEEE